MIHAVESASCEAVTLRRRKFPTPSASLPSLTTSPTKSNFGAAPAWRPRIGSNPHGFRRRMVCASGNARCARERLTSPRLRARKSYRSRVASTSQCPASFSAPLWRRRQSYRHRPLSISVKPPRRIPRCRTCRRRSQPQPRNRRCPSAKAGSLTVPKSFRRRLFHRPDTKCIRKAVRSTSRAALPIICPRNQPCAACRNKRHSAS